MIDGLQYKTEISLDEFIETFVPKLPKGLEVTSDFVTQVNKAQAWHGFLPPSDADGGEGAIFKHLTPIFDKMVIQAQKQWGNRCPRQRWSLLTAPTSTPSTPERASTFKPDAYFYRTASLGTTSYSYYDMAFAVEFKKHSGNAEVVDNTTKVLYAMQYMIAVDARRRFIFGITIEDTSLRLWYANRSMLISSVPLDIAQDKPRFIQIFLSFAYAPDTDMGFDPSVELVQHAQGEFYHIAVGNTQYKTIKALHDHGANYLLSQAARIFKVKKVGDTEDNIYVLKDLWPEQDRKPEHLIYDEIIRDVRRIDPEQVDIVKLHLFTPVDHVFVEVNGVRDDTKASMMRNKTLVSSKVVQLPDTMRHVHAPDKTCHRTHYRIVFKEYATPIHKAKKMGEVFAVLADLMELFRIFHRCGWVHRDISAGNVYLYEGRGMLGDLEFAKNTADNFRHEIRMGTIDFMPVETIAQKFLPLTCRRPPTTFRYNALHDIESAWWLGVWMMHFFKPEGHKESDQSSHLRQVETLRLFPGTLSYDSRLLILRYRSYFLDSFEGWIAEVSTRAVEILNNVRILLLQLYMDLEQTFPNGLPMLSSQANPASGAAFPGGPVSDIHEPIKNLFLEAKDAYKDTELVSFEMV